MWPSNRLDLKLRVIAAIGALFLAKAATTTIPFAYKGVIDSLAKASENPELILGIAVPIILVVAFGVANIVDSGLQQLRDILFAKVGQHAVRELAKKTFIHLHRLSLRFHLQRRIGGLSRIIERGTKGIETIVRFTMLNTAPAILEFIIVSSIFTYLFGVKFLFVVVGIIALYVIFTIKASNWRITIACLIMKRLNILAMRKWRQSALIGQWRFMKRRR